MAKATETGKKAAGKVAGKGGNGKAGKMVKYEPFTAEKGRLQCHFVSNTHWDREWQYSFQRTRYMLVDLLDTLMDIFEKEPRYKYFVLDSQTAPLQDYLEIKPENAGKITKLIEEGKLVVGPWFTLPDVNVIGGESLIRNLLLGHKIAKKFGRVPKTGYSPFSWGQLSQMPQIYQGFGIDFMAFYRGINSKVAPCSEFIWEAPDGSRIAGSRLGFRPRYNVWYIIQRAVFWNEEDTWRRSVQWGEGHGPFRFVTPDKANINYALAHPKYEYHKERIKAQCEQALKEQDKDWTTPHRFWANGHDWSGPDIREAQMIADCAEAVADKADVFHSTFEAMQKGTLEYQNDSWPLYRGEMRNFPLPDWKTGPMMSNNLSSRLYIKQDNFATERLLSYYAEPLAVFASLLGAAYPQNFIDYCYNMLIQNHGHDSVGCCCRDIPHQDMLYLSRCAREVSTCVMERSMVDIAGAIDLSKWSKDEMALVVYNPAPATRTEVAKVHLDIPLEWKATGFEIVDEKDQPLTVQIDDILKDHSHNIQTPTDVQNYILANRYLASVEFPRVPGYGYRTYKVKPITKEIFPPMRKTMATGPVSMENEFVAVAINANGTLEITDKASGHTFSGVGYFRDKGEAGDPWCHKTPTHDEIFTTVNEKASVALIKQGELETSFRVTINWSLPETHTADEQGRTSNHMVPYRIVNTITLRKGQRWVDVVSEIDNTAQYHWLQLAVPSRLDTDVVYAQSHFDVIERPMKDSEDIVYAHEFEYESPMDSFIDLSDGKVGLAVLNEGLKSYRPLQDGDRTALISLLRSAPMRLGWARPVDHGATDKDIQMLGKHTVHYAFLPHAGDWAKAGLWQAADAFNLHLQAGQMAPTKHGTLPLTNSFLEITPENLHVSAIKRSEAGGGWVVRLCNVSEKTAKAAIRLNGGFGGPQTPYSPVERVQAEYALPKGKGKKWSKVRLVNLEELPQQDLAMDGQGWVKLEVTKKKIVTLEFVP